MPRTVPIAIIGLDTSHTIEFTRLLQAPDTPLQARILVGGQLGVGALLGHGALCLDRVSTQSNPKISREGAKYMFTLFLNHS